MKKILLLLCALLGTVGAWAAVTQPTLTTDANNPTYYVIQNFRSGKYANYAEASAQLQQVTSADAGATSLWYFMANGDGVSIVPATDPSLKLASTTSATAEGAVWYLPENPYKSGVFCVSLTSGATANCWDDQGGHTTIGYWQPASGDADGTSWNIVEIPVTKAEVDAGTVDLSWALTKSDVLARLAPLSSLSVYTAANIAAVRNAADESELNAALKAFETNISLFCRSNKYLVVGESACSYVASPTGYEEAIQLESAGSGTFYLKGYKSEKYVGNVAVSAAINTDASPTTAFYFQSYNGYTVVRPSDTAASYDGYRYIHNGGSGCVGWEPSGTNTQHTIAEVELPAEIVNVTYHLMVGGVDKTQATVECGVGDAPAVPVALQYAYTTYSYDISTIASNTSDVYVTATFNLPFATSSDFANSTWYYATLRGKYLRADDSAKDGSGRYQTNASNEHTDAYKWAFFGNPVDGIYVMNKNQGSGKYLYQDAQFNFTSLANPTADNHALFAVTPNSNGGFTLRSISGGATYYVNDAGNGGNIGFWNSASGANDGGSNWVVEDVATSDKATLGEAITAAQALVAVSDVPGYPSAAAAATLSSAITTAQGVYDDPSGDYYAAYTTLNTAIATAKAAIVYTPRTDVYYTITSARGSMVYDATHDNHEDSDGNKFLWYTTSLDNTDVNHLWGFIEQDGNYYMYNVGKQQFATVTTSGTYQYGDKGTWAFSDTPAYVTFDAGINNSVVAPNVRIRATVATTGTTYSMSISTGYIGPVITYDAQGDGGIPMLLAVSSVPVDAAITAAMEAKVEDVTPYRNALKEIIDACAGITMGSGIGQFKANETYTTALSAANNAYNNASATKSELQTAMQNLEAAIATLSLNVPADGYYRLKNVATGKYLNAKEATGWNVGTKAVYANGNITDAATIIKVSSDGTRMYNQGYGFGWAIAGSEESGVAWVTPTPDKDIHWLPGNAAGQIAFAICYGNGTGDYASYLTKGIYTVDVNDEAVIAGTDYTADAAQWIVEPATDFTIALDGPINDNYYATLCVPFDVTVEGATAYTVTKGTGNVLTTTEVEGTIAAGTPVLLIGSGNSATATIAENANYSSAISTETALTGSYLEVAGLDGATNYVLGKDDKKAGFFHTEGTTVKANSAYLAGDESTSAIEAFYFDLDSTGLVGDVNGDGGVTIADVTALVNIILGKDNVEPYQYNHDAADVNGDESVTIADVTALVNIILGKTI